MSSRPAIPEQLKRQVKLEAGHRCAIPTCQQIPIEIAHIVPWAEVLVHEFENLIALCPTCHTRYDRGDIDRASMQIYKRNLGLMTSRYSEFERRVLQWFEAHPDEETLGGFRSWEIDLMHLVQDGMLEWAGNTVELGPETVMIVQWPETLWRITPAGRDLIAQIRSATELK